MGFSYDSQDGKYTVAESSLAKSGPPSDIVKLNDSVYELYTPEKGEPNVEIVFFHGLQTTSLRDAYWRAWTSETDSGESFWPKEWLPSKFPKARIVSVSYDSCAYRSATSGRQDLLAIGERLVEDLIHLGKVGQGKPVVLVGHSVGGLVIKQVVLEAKKQLNAIPDNGTFQRRLSNFLSNIKGLFYFATPHYDNGSNLERLFSSVPVGWKGPSRLMQKVTGKDFALLNDEFRVWRKIRKDVKAFAICETNETISRKGSFRKKSFMVVAGSSASIDIHRDNFMFVAGDHFQVAKPRSQLTSSFQALTRFISTAVRIRASDSEMDESDKVATGTPVEEPQGFTFRSTATRPTVPDHVDGIPVKSGPRKHFYSKPSYM